ncbi:MAG: trimethylamine methyltransferase family protein [Synergistaceae bacterium]|nr:trimethylamine methyltransferase family protein [Synergistaceae bacterium]
MYTTKSKFVSSNRDYNQTICWRMLSDGQSEEIFLTAAELLERSGAQVANKRALEIFAKGGCWVDGDMVRIPSTKLDWAIRTAPSRLTVCNQQGKRAVMMESENVAYGPAWGATKIMDLKTGEPRAITLEDVASQMHLSEQLEDIEFVSAFGAAEGMDGVPGLKALEQVIRYSTKPIVHPACCAKHAAYATEMAAAAAGGMEAMRRNPYIVLCATCDEPRWHSEEALDVVMYAAENGVPCIYNNKLVAGQTAPASSAGTLVVALANYLVALTLAQLVREGAPLIAGCQFSFYDEDNKTTPSGAPETSLMGAGFANLLRWLRLPTFTVSGITDSMASDSQLGVECGMNLLTSSLAGTNMISGGLLGSGTTASFTLLVIAEEVMTQVYRIMRSFAIDEDRKAVGVYDKVEPGGSYLGEEHTTLFFKPEQYWPNLFSRLRIQDWQAAGSKSLGQRATDFVETLLANPRAECDKKIADAVHAVVAKAEKDK